MENINENEVVATEAAPAPVILEPAVEVAEKVEKVITFNSIFKEAWGLFVYFFEEHTLAMILLLVVMIIPVINFLVLPIVILIAGRKISGEAEPFKGVVMMYLNKFWQLIVLGFVQIFALIWKILPIVIIPLILCTFEFTLGMHSTLLNYLLPISAVLAVVPFCLYLFKYMYGWAFAAQALFFEDKKEVSALKRSWELTFGNKKGIFYYLISLGLIIGLINFIMTLILVLIFAAGKSSYNELGLNVVHAILYFPLIIFMLVFLTKIYFELKNNFGNIKMKVSRGMKALIISIMIVLPVVGMLASVSLAVLQSVREKAQNQLLMDQIRQTAPVEDSVLPEAKDTKNTPEAKPIKSATAVSNADIYLLQYADGKVDVKGEANDKVVMSAFDKYNWDAEIKQSKVSKVASPNISIVDKEASKILVINGLNTGDKNVFGLQYVTTDKKDGKDMINVYIGSSFSDRAQVEESVQKFLAKDWNYLSKNYSNLLASKAR